MDLSPSRIFSMVVLIVFFIFLRAFLTVEIQSEMKTKKSNELENKTKFILFVNTSRIWIKPYFAEIGLFTKINITNSPDLISNLTMKYYIQKSLTYNCKNKRIYILKENSLDESDSKQILDVIEYDKVTNFLIIKRVLNMFNDASSISSDWTTGNIYWIEYIKKENKYSIKFTNESFIEPQYIIQPTGEISINKIQVYPKRNEIIYLNGSLIWYTSMLPNSTPQLLFSPPENSYEIKNFEIDYALDRLCWKGLENLYCIDLSVSTRPLNLHHMDSQKTAVNPYEFTVFYNVFHWTIFKDDELALYSQIGNNEINQEEMSINIEGSIYFISSHCSYEIE